MLTMPKCHNCGKFCRPVEWKMIYSGALLEPQEEIYKCAACVERHGSFAPQEGIKPEHSCGRLTHNYRVTLPNGETLHTGHGPLADVWLNRHGGKLERIPLASIKSVAAEMWDGSPLTAALISVDRLRAILNDKDGQMDAMFKELGAWRAAFVRHNGLAYDPERDAIVHMDTGREYKSVGEQEAPFTCKYCGQPSWIDPSDQSPPPDYCHEIDHGTAEDRTGS